MAQSNCIPHTPDSNPPVPSVSTAPGSAQGEALLAPMPPPPLSKGTPGGVVHGAGRISPVRPGMCVHGARARRCLVGCVGLPPTVGAFPPGQAARVLEAEEAAAAARQLQKIHPDLLESCAGGEAKQRAAQIIREFAPQPARGNEQPKQAEDTEYEVEEVEEVEEEEEPEEVQPRAPHRNTLTPPPLPKNDASTQMTLKEETNVSVQATPPAPSTGSPSTHPSPAVHPSSVQPYVPITLPPAPVAAPLGRPCGHEARVARRRAEQRAHAAVAAATAAEEQERLARLAAHQQRVKEENERHAMLQQVKRERILAEQAALQAAAQRQAAEQALRQVHEYNLKHQHQVDTAMKQAQEQHQQYVLAANQERMVAERARQEAVVAGGADRNLVDAAMKLLTAAQQRDRRDISPDRGPGGYVTPPLNEEPTQQLAQGTPQASASKPLASASASQPPVPEPPAACDDAQSELSKGFTADRSVYSDGPSPPDDEAGPLFSEAVGLQATLPAHRALTMSTSIPTVYPTAGIHSQPQQLSLQQLSQQHQQHSKPQISQQLSQQHQQPSKKQSSEGSTLGIAEQLAEDNSTTPSALQVFTAGVRRISSTGTPTACEPGTYVVPIIDVPSTASEREARGQVQSMSYQYSKTLLSDPSSMSTSVPPYALDRDDSPPPFPSADSPAISPTEVAAAAAATTPSPHSQPHSQPHQSQQPRSQPSQQQPSPQPTQQQPIEDEVTQALADALVLVQRAETAEAEAKRRADEMEKRAKSLEAQLAEAEGRRRGPSYKVGAIDEGVLAEMLSTGRVKENKNPRTTEKEYPPHPNQRISPIRRRRQSQGWKGFMREWDRAAAAVGVPNTPPQTATKYG